MSRRFLDKMVKYLIFDSGSIINFTQNCLVSMFRDLDKVFQGDFLVTPEVIYETTVHPLRIKKFEWGAIRIQSLIDEEILKPFQDEEVCSYKDLKEKTQEVLNLVNNSLFSEGKPIHLIEGGEAECLALSLILSERKIPNAVVIDERTARMVCENPDQLHDLMESKLEAKLEFKKENLAVFQSIKVFRSTELVYMAFKKGLIDSDRKKLEAILYALKFGGCSVSENELEFMKKA
jgi:predicted nucleic acid-binding protein